jgi:hypothetical protein
MRANLVGEFNDWHADDYVNKPLWLGRFFGGPYIL